VKSIALKTTLGDLIVALTDEANRSLHDEKAAYQVVADIVSDLVHRDSPGFGNEQWRSSG
jgi:hypothetical protein